MRDLILGLSLLFLGPTGPEVVKLPPPPVAEFDVPPALKPEEWRRDPHADRAARRSARTAARRRNMAMLGAIGAQLDSQANALAAQSAAQTAAYHYRLTNYLSLQQARFPAYQAPAYYPGWSGYVRPDCTPSRSTICSPGVNCTPSRSSLSSAGPVGSSAECRD